MTKGTNRPFSIDPQKTYIVAEHLKYSDSYNRLGAFSVKDGVVTTLTDGSRDNFHVSVNNTTLTISNVANYDSDVVIIQID